MKEEVKKIFENLFTGNPGLAGCRESLVNAFQMLTQCYSGGGKVLICGNGGSASDSEHIVGELMKGFLRKRRISGHDAQKLKLMYPEAGEYLANSLQGALPAISLVSQTSILTAYSNDVDPDMVFAQLAYGYGREGDALIGLSTSGNSRNVVNAIKVAKAFGLKTIGFTGESGGIMKACCDVLIAVPANETYKIQEYHLAAYHALCAMTEAEFFAE